MIKTMCSKTLQDCDTLCDALKITGQGGPVISVIGAGGKTSVIRRIATEYLNDNRPAVVTTTTHMRTPHNPYFLPVESMAALVRKLDETGQVWLGIPAENDKIKSVSRSFLQEVLDLKLPVLVEADGARRMPCKAPAVHEPVVIWQTTLVINVYGLDCLGKTIGSCCYMPGVVAKILGTDLQHRLAPADLATLGMSRYGGKKGISEAMDYHVILNKADNKERIELADTVCREFEKLGFEDVTVLSEGNQQEYEDTD